MFSELASLRIWGLLPTVLPPADLVHEPEVQDFMAWSSELSAEDAPEVLSALARMLPEVEVAPASVLALCCGALVEQSGQATQAFPALLTHFQRLQELLNTGVTPPAGAFRFTIMGLMAMLCRSAANRAKLQQLPGLAEWLNGHDGVSDHFYYLAGMLQVSDEESLYVLFPEQGTGLEVKVDQVNNVFHLLTLLQPLVVQYQAELGLCRTYSTPDPQFLRYAQGLTAEPPVKDVDVALFDWLNATAYQGGPLDKWQMAWGELPVRDLPRLQGRVVLLGTELPGGPRRSWDVGFCAVLHGAHLPQVQLRQVLAPETVRQALQTLHPGSTPPGTPENEARFPSPAPAAASRRSWWQRLTGGGRPA